MSRKKNRGKKTAALAPREQPASAVANGDSVVLAQPAEPARGPRPAVRRKASPEPTWLAAGWTRAARTLGSLQLAVILLTLFAAVLALGTEIESAYSARVAQEVVYRSWWFTLLLTLLGVNILFAALKKLPWKRYQIGFLITHLGLLTMLAGGVLTSLSGTDAMMALIDSPAFDIQENIGAPQSSNRITHTDDSIIRVRWFDRQGNDRTKVFPFRHGSFQWRSDEYLVRDLPADVAILSTLAHPFPRGWEADLGAGNRIEVLNFYPHARQEPFSAASRSDRDVHPAVKVQLISPQFGRMPPEWLALSFDHSPSNRPWPFWAGGPAMMELLGEVPSEMLKEFLEPPPRSALGEKGVLVLRLDGQTHRFDVHEHLDRAVPLPGGKQLRIKKYYPNYSKRENESPWDPALEFEITGADGRPQGYVLTARALARSGAMSADGKHLLGHDPHRVVMWYHPPDFRFGRGESLKGLLQFAQTEDGQLYYRAFNSKIGPYGFELSGAVKGGKETHPVWSGMNWRFQVIEHLPRAVYRPRFVPINARPGLDKREDLAATIRGRVTTPKGSKEFWVAQGRPGRVVSVSETEHFLIEFGIKTEELPFTIKLLRAEQTNDPGTQSAASYSSYVQITDSGAVIPAWMPRFALPVTNRLGFSSGGEEIIGEDRVITMNEPLNHRGYKVYQSQYEFRTWDNNGRPVSLSGFTVGRDPGKWLKYLGSIMLALGIACMFYMKAYFFKPRSRPAAPAGPAPGANGAPPQEG
jgi:hypothetical protein